MEKKRVNKIVIALIVLLITSLTLMGCQSILNKLEDQTLRENTVKMITALMMDDRTAAYNLVDDSQDFYDFYDNYKALSAFFGTVKTYDFELLSAYRGYTLLNGKAGTYSTAAYKLDANGESYVIEVSSHSAYEGLTGFFVVPFEQTDYYVVGDIGNMSDANWFQWAMLLSNVLVILALIIAFIDCCVHKVKLKALWLVLIAICFCTFGITLYPSGFRFIFDMGWIISYTAYITYGGGTQKFKVLIPLGLIIYLCVRRKMIELATPKTVYPEDDDIYALFRPEPDEPTPTDDGIEAGAQPEKPIGEGEKEDKESDL